MTGAERFDNQSRRSYAADSGIPECGAEDDATSPSPGQVAEAFLRTIPLPVPDPYIAPNGEAIVGLPAFLETNGTLTHPQTAASTALDVDEVQMVIRR